MDKGCDDNQIEELKMNPSVSDSESAGSLNSSSSESYKRDNSIRVLKNAVN